MKLLNINIKPFLNIIWVSEKARKVWSSIIADISQMVQELEIESVAEDQRPCAWRTISEESLPDFSERCLDKCLIVHPVKYVGRWEGFIHHTPPVEKGKPKNIYCIISKSQIYIKNYLEAFNKGDNERQGEMLGFPNCCIDSFKSNWEKGYFDYIPFIKNRDKVTPLSNPILRYIGVRVGFHIPCSFNCEESIRRGQERLDLAKDYNIVKLLIGLLSMPVSWNCYHGIAEVRTPIFYIITSSLPTVKKITINLKGSFIPEESKKGIVYPFTEVE